MRWNCTKQLCTVRFHYMTRKKMLFVSTVLTCSQPGVLVVKKSRVCTNFLQYPEAYCKPPPHTAWPGIENNELVQQNFTHHLLLLLQSGVERYPAVIVHPSVKCESQVITAHMTARFLLLKQVRKGCSNTDAVAGHVGACV